MANDRAVPTEIRNRYKGWGLAADEFTDTDHWPHQLYVREARRMVADYVVTEADCRGSHRCGEAARPGICPPLTSDATGNRLSCK